MVSEGLTRSREHQIVSLKLSWTLIRKLTNPSRALTRGSRACVALLVLLVLLLLVVLIDLVVLLFVLCLVTGLPLTTSSLKCRSCLSGALLVPVPFSTVCIGILMATSDSPLAPQPCCLSASVSGEGRRVLTQDPPPAPPPEEQILSPRTPTLSGSSQAADRRC